jgi:hypothetical protein
MPDRLYTEDEVRAIIDLVIDSAQEDDQNSIYDGWQGSPRRFEIVYERVEAAYGPLGAGWEVSEQVTELLHRRLVRYPRITRSQLVDVLTQARDWAERFPSGQYAQMGELPAWERLWSDWLQEQLGEWDEIPVVRAENARGEL